MFAWYLSDRGKGNGSADGGNGQQGAGQLAGLGNLSSRSIALLGLVGVLGEHNQASLVVLESLHVEGEGLVGLVGAAVVNRDAHSLGVLSVDASLLKQDKRHSYE